MDVNGGYASSEDVMSETSVGGGGGGGGGDGGCGDGGEKLVLKKGPWTPAEDAILTEYVTKHGEGNWNAVQRNSGLSRCGKSCRLRWANHLRPNLKKDNEIKNYWNTRTKRRHRAGLPLYPQEVQREAAAFHFQHHQHQQHQQQQRRRQQEQQQQHHPHASSSSLPSFLSSPQNQNPTANPSFSLFDLLQFSPTPNPLQIHPNSHFMSNTNPQFHLFHDTKDGGFELNPPVSHLSTYPSPSSLFNQSMATQLLPTPSLQFNSGNFELNPPPTPIYGAPFEQTGGLLPLFEGELPLAQTPLQSTPASSATSGGGDYMITSVASSSVNDYGVAPPVSRANSGLLDDLLMEAQTLSKRNENSNKGKAVVVDEFTEEDADVDLGLVFGDSGGGDATPENQWDDSSSGQSSIGMISMKETVEDMNSIDDELTSLLETFPSSMMPVPEWYHESGDVFNGQSSSMAAGDGVFDIGQEASPSPAATSAMDYDLIMGSYCWNNMPGIC
ncbi:hypothetical protein L1049_023413 [Liquidambar formosana]|uniref:Uncharacterized protein n=1 Tax=Liquidambar formosana TaxID=63359 RepID=A0AAP0WXP5_LIQFO